MLLVRRSAGHLDNIRCFDHAVDEKKSHVQPSVDRGDDETTTTVAADTTTAVVTTDSFLMHDIAFRQAATSYM